MGTWGAGLYSNDFSMDLRSTIRAVSRLPFDGERLTELLCATEPGAALNAADEDHTTFWLVVADQFVRRGIASRRVRGSALDIIDTGRDLEMQRRLGQTPAGLEKRRRSLAELRERIAIQNTTSTARDTLKKPQSFLMDVGDVLVYPTCGGDCRNPYASRPDQLKIYGPKGGQPWFLDGWGARSSSRAGSTSDRI
jgi:hypothetical protein